MTKQRVSDALYHHMRAKDEEKCIRLLEKNPSLIDKELRSSDQTVFLLACIYNLKKVIDYLLTKNVNIHHITTRKRENAIHQAVFSKNVELVKQLHGLGINIDQKNYLGNTPLIQISNFGCVEMAECLIELGADVNHENDYGMSFLHFFKKKRFPLDMSFLVKHLDKFDEQNQKEIKKLRLKQLVEKGEL